MVKKMYNIGVNYENDDVNLYFYVLEHVFNERKTNKVIARKNPKIFKYALNFKQNLISLNYKLCRFGVFIKGILFFLLKKHIIKQ